MWGMACNLLIYIECSNINQRVQILKSQDCDSCCRGFEPHQPPQYLNSSIHAAFKLVWVHDVGARIKLL